MAHARACTWRGCCRAALIMSSRNAQHLARTSHATAQRPARPPPACAHCGAACMPMWQRSMRRRTSASSSRPSSAASSGPCRASKAARPRARTSAGMLRGPRVGQHAAGPGGAARSRPAAPAGTQHRGGGRENGRRETSVPRTCRSRAAAVRAGLWTATAQPGPVLPASRPPGRGVPRERGQTAVHDGPDRSSGRRSPCRVQSAPRSSDRLLGSPPCRPAPRAGPPPSSSPLPRLQTRRWTGLCHTDQLSYEVRPRPIDSAHGGR